MLNKMSMLWCIGVMLLLLGACSGHDTTSFAGKQYKPTEKVETVYQVGQIPKSCRVTAHVLATLPPKFSGQNFADAIADEAKLRGGDIILVGQSRRSEDEEQLSFTYYGPVLEYNISQWAGWSFGYEKWEDQGEWVNIGYTEWGNGSIEFDYPVVMQLAFLRCREK